MDSANLVRMANRIGEFFEAMPEREEALQGIAEHIRKFWEPRMRAIRLGVSLAALAATVFGIGARAEPIVGFTDKSSEAPFPDCECQLKSQV